MKKLLYTLQTPMQNLALQNRRGTRVGENDSYKLPEAPQTPQDLGKMPKIYVLEPELLQKTIRAQSSYSLSIRLKGPIMRDLCTSTVALHSQSKRPYIALQGARPYNLTPPKKISQRVNRMVGL